MIDVTNLPTGTPVWITIGGAVILLALSISERAAKLKGPFGAVARWWNDRQVRAVQRKKSLNETIDELVDQRMEAINDDLEDLRGQLASLRQDLVRERVDRRKEREGLLRDHAEEIAKVRERERLQHRYIVIITNALRTLEIWAADHGLELPPPPFQTFPEWLADQERRATARNPPDK